MATGRPAGRPSKPVEVKRALGNPGQRALPDYPVAGSGLPGVAGIPDAPGFATPGSEMWMRVWSAGRSWLSPDADFDVVTLLCRAADEAEDLRLGLERGDFPRFYSLPNGSEVTHPAVTQLKELRVQMTAWLSSLGFSPADRARLGVGEVRQSDFMDELERRRRERASGS